MQELFQFNSPGDAKLKGKWKTKYGSFSLSDNALKSKTQLKMNIPLFWSGHSLYKKVFLHGIIKLNTIDAGVTIKPLKKLSVNVSPTKRDLNLDYEFKWNEIDTSVHSYFNGENINFHLELHRKLMNFEGELRTKFSFGKQGFAFKKIGHNLQYKGFTLDVSNKGNHVAYEQEIHGITTAVKVQEEKRQFTAALAFKKKLDNITLRGMVDTQKTVKAQVELDYEKYYRGALTASYPYRKFPLGLSLNVKI